MSARKQFTPEFKREAVQLVESGSRPASAIDQSRLKEFQKDSTGTRPEGSLREAGS